MNDNEHEQLIDYLAGQLSSDEREYVEAKIAADPRWRERHEHHARLFEVIADYRDECRCAPGDLVERTMCQVARAELVERPASRRGPIRMSPSSAPPSGRSRVRAADIIVAASVAIIASIIIIPAVLHGRVGARLEACSNNLREIGSALNQYSEIHDGQFPQIPTKGPLAAASIYAPLLTSGGFITDVSVFLCPDSPQADWSETGEHEVPTLEKLNRLAALANSDSPNCASSALQLKGLLERAGGSYGYNLGYVSDGVYHPTRNMSRSNFALMADQPNLDNPDLSSSNHGHCGQNVLFEDGRVDYLTSCKVDGSKDDIFRNDEGLIAAGVHLQDSVIGAGIQSPLLFGSITP